MTTEALKDDITQSFNDAKLKFIEDRLNQFEIFGNKLSGSLDDLDEYVRNYYKNDFGTVDLSRMMDKSSIILDKLSTSIKDIADVSKIEGIDCKDIRETLSQLNGYFKEQSEQFKLGNAQKDLFMDKSKGMIGKLNEQMTPIGDNIKDVVKDKLAGITDGDTDQNNNNVLRNGMDNIPRHRL